MEDLSLHVLDVAENSIAAGASCVEIQIRESRRENALVIEIADDGSGMSQDVLKKATGPFFTSRTTRRVGLGLPFFEQAARAAGGQLNIESAPGVGTKVIGVFQYDHPDRQPLGDMASTLLTLVVGYPATDFEYVHRTDNWEITFSTKQLKSQLGDVPVNSAAGIAAARESLGRLKSLSRA